MYIVFILSEESVYCLTSARKIYLEPMYFHGKVLVSILFNKIKYRCNMSQIFQDPKYT